LPQGGKDEHTTMKPMLAKTLKIEDVIKNAFPKCKDKSITLDDFRKQCILAVDVLDFGDDGTETDKMIDGKSFTFEGDEYNSLNDDAIETVLWYQKYFE